jgi:hypothetical protein
MKIYYGWIEDGQAWVLREDLGRAPAGALPWVRQAGEMTPRAFDWGHNSPGAMKLALALLVDVLGANLDLELASCYFSADVVARLPREGWALSEYQIRESLGTVRSVPLTARSLGVLTFLKEKLHQFEEEEIIVIGLDALRWKLDLVDLLNQHDGQPAVAPTGNGEAGEQPPARGDDALII